MDDKGANSVSNDYKEQIKHRSAPPLNGGWDFDNFTGKDNSNGKTTADFMIITRTVGYTVLAAVVKFIK